MLKMCTKSTFIVIASLITTYAVQFEWLPDDNRLDCVVGISFNKTPIGIGVFIRPFLIITSANPLEDYILKDQTKLIKIHAINGSPKISKELNVNCIMLPYHTSPKGRKNSKFWIRQGFSSDNSPAHDLYVIAVENFAYNLTQMAALKDVPYRFPHMIKLVTPNFDIDIDGLMYAGFGFLHQRHVKNSVILKIVDREKELILEDCDEWVPKSWGHFICLKNVENYPGIQSGSPLFQKGLLIGIGCFAMQKNGESVLVFTDLRPYLAQLRYCAHNETHAVHDTYRYDMDVYPLF